MADFCDHVTICYFSTDALYFKDVFKTMQLQVLKTSLLYLDCYHCQKQSEHVATLVDHLKSHGKTILWVF